MKQQAPSCNDPFETNAITVSEAVSHILNNTESIREYE